MASSSESSAARYAYQKPSTIATRALVTGTNPSETTSTSSHDVESAQDRPSLQRKTTDHYQQAVQQATASKVDSLQSDVRDAAAGNGQPLLERQQSWKQSDLKRDAMAKILTEQSPGHGYTSTSTS